MKRYFTKEPENTQDSVPLLVGLIQRIFNQRNSDQRTEERSTLKSYKMHYKAIKGDIREE